jgi:hypothetical protein
MHNPAHSSPTAVMMKLRIATLFTVTSLSCAALPALGQDAAIVLTGAEASRDSRYAYLGAVLPAFGGKLGQGLVQRYWVDYNTYTYEQTPGHDIHARVGGVEALLGYQGSNASNWWGAYAGVRYANTKLSPDDLANQSRGGRTRGKVQLEGETAIGGDWRLNGIVSHLFGDGDYYLRLRAMDKLGNGLSLGPEVIFQGDSTYRATKLGVVLGGIKVGAESALTFRLGASHFENQGTSAYAAVEAYIPF